MESETVEPFFVSYLESLNCKRLNVVFLFNNELLSEAVMTLGTNWEPTRAS